MYAGGSAQTGTREARQGLGIGAFSMKRFHVHVAVGDLKQSIRFYSALFAAEPSITRADYAKWMLDDPRVNFAISTRGREPGLDHLGIQAESADELKEIYTRLHKAGGNVVEQGQTACCYAKSESHGSTIRPVFHGRLSTRRGKASTTATARGSASRALHVRSRVARLKSTNPPNPVAARPNEFAAWLTSPTMSCSFAPATRPDPSWPKPS